MLVSPRFAGDGDSVALQPVLTQVELAEVGTYEIRDNRFDSGTLHTVREMAIGKLGFFSTARDVD